MSLATDYQRMIEASRRLQLANDAGAVRALEQALARAAGDLRRAILETPRGIIGERYRRQLLASLEKTLDQFRDNFKETLDNHIVEAARIVEEREKELVRAALKQHPELMPAPERLAFIEQNAAVSVRFGEVPRLVLERLYTRSFSDGLKLSDRLHNLDLEGRRGVLNVVGEGIAKGESARNMAKRIAPLIEQEGVDNVRHRALRIARTEINTAFREGHAAAITNADGSKKSYVHAMGWRLSPSHPRVDICDAWAGDDAYDLGAGNYPPGSLPAGHPCCLCFTVTVLKVLMHEQFVSHAPQPDKVRESQRKYYGLR